MIGIGYYLFVYKSYGYKSWNDMIGGTMAMLGVILALMTFVDSPYKSGWYEKKHFEILLPLNIAGNFFNLSNGKSEK